MGLIKSKFNLKKPILSSLFLSSYLFVIALILAYFEVQIEGPNGWASALPTWRNISPNITWIFGGRPVTGYHVSLNLLLLLFFHWPILYNKWSWIFEARALSSYALLATIWDFLWFVINPNFGLNKYDGEHIWWFTHWFLGIPVDYYFGILMAITIRCLPSLFRKELFKQSIFEGITFAFFSITLTTLFTVIYSLV